MQRILSWFDNRPLDEEAIQRFRESRGPVLVRKLFNAFGSLAYVISPRGAERFVHECFPLCNHNIPIACLQRVVRAFSIDCMMNRRYRHWNAFAVFPPLAISPNDKALSDTRDGGEAAGEQSPLAGQ